MSDNISAKEMLHKVIEWKKTFLWITILATIVAIILLMLMPKQFQSTTVLFPTRQFTVSKTVVVPNVGNQHDYNIMGEDYDCDRLIQVLNCNSLKFEVADALNLWDRWNVKKDKFAIHYLKERWDDMVTVKRTEYKSAVTLEVYDYSPDGAAEIANSIAMYVDTIKFRMNKPIVDHVVSIVSDEYVSTLARIKVLEDSVSQLRSMGIYHYKSMVKAYMKDYSEAVQNGDQVAIKRLETKLDTLAKYGSAYENSTFYLEEYATKYPQIKMKYDEALVNAKKMLPMKFVVERALSDEYKAKPKRLIFLFITVVAPNLIALFILLFRDRLKNTEITPLPTSGMSA